MAGPSTNAGSPPGGAASVDSAAAAAANPATPPSAPAPLLAANAGPSNPVEADDALEVDRLAEDFQDQNLDNSPAHSPPPKVPIVAGAALPPSALPPGPRTAKSMPQRFSSSGGKRKVAKEYSGRIETSEHSIRQRNSDQGSFRPMNKILQQHQQQPQQHQFHHQQQQQQQHQQQQQQQPQPPSLEANHAFAAPPYRDAGDASAASSAQTSFPIPAPPQFSPQAPAAAVPPPAAADPSNFRRSASFKTKVIDIGQRIMHKMNPRKSYSEGDKPAKQSKKKDRRSDLGRTAAKPRHWTPEEDELLRQSVAIHGEKQWKKIAELVPGRNHTQCLQRWSKVLTPGLKKGQWSTEEDDLLLKLASAQLEECDRAGKARKVLWGVVKNDIPGRTAKQCRERWVNNLNPEIRRGDWSAEEDEKILDLYVKMPQRWAAIAKALPGRTENAVKIRWKTLTRDDAEQRSLQRAAQHAQKILDKQVVPPHEVALIAQQTQQQQQQQQQQHYHHHQQPQHHMLHQQQHHANAVTNVAAAAAARIAAVHSYNSSSPAHGSASNSFNTHSFMPASLPMDAPQQQMGAGLGHNSSAFHPSLSSAPTSHSLTDFGNTIGTNSSGLDGSFTLPHQQLHQDALRPSMGTGLGSGSSMSGASSSTSLGTSGTDIAALLGMDPVMGSQSHLGGSTMSISSSNSMSDGFLGGSTTALDPPHQPTLASLRGEEGSSLTGLGLSNGAAGDLNQTVLQQLSGSLTIPAAGSESIFTGSTSSLLQGPDISSGLFDSARGYDAVSAGQRETLIATASGQLNSGGMMLNPNSGNDLNNPAGIPSSLGQSKRPSLKSSFPRPNSSTSSGLGSWRSMAMSDGQIWTDAPENFPTDLLDTSTHGA